MAAVSSEPMSPVDAASPLGGTTNKDDGSNGFTAVNGRSPPTEGSRIRLEEEIRPKSQHQEEPRRVVSNEERPAKTNGVEPQRNGSPISSSKRKRSEEEDESSSEMESDNEDTMRRSHSTNYRSATVEEWNNDREMNEDQMESRLVAELQRDRQHTSNGHGAVMDIDSPVRGHHQDGYHTTPAGVQVDPKKRKRAFTNRTKTGCQTCRRRKKKCDEAKPECNNCTRGGFLCEGYLVKSHYPKSSTPKQSPMAIQARGDSYGEPSNGNIHPRPPRNSGGYMDSPNQHHNGSRQRPMQVDDEPERSMSSQWSHSPYPTHYQGRRDVEPSHGLPIQNHSLQMRDYDRQMAPVMHPGLSSLHGHVLHGSASAVAVAQSALRQHQPPPTPQPQPYMPGVRMSERDKMLAGELYKPYDNMLQQERDKCKDRLYNFNSYHGDSQQERVRQLRKIFENQSQSGHEPNAMAASQRMGKGVYIDAPFRCDYGYNIIIGNDVAIETGCFISDPREVRIGANTMIGPDVHIMGKQFPYGHEQRNGALHGKARGYKIRIGEGVCIGAGCKISPSEELCDGELIIGDGAFIPAGTIVTKNVPGFTIFGQKASGQADVLRPLYVRPDEKGDERRGRDMGP